MPAGCYGLGTPIEGSVEEANGGTCLSLLDPPPCFMLKNPALVEARRLQGRKVLVDKGDRGQGESIPQRGALPNRLAKWRGGRSPGAGRGAQSRGDILSGQGEIFFERMVNGVFGVHLRGAGDPLGRR